MVGFVPKPKMQEMKKCKDALQRHVKFRHNCGLQKTFPPFVLAVGFGHSCVTGTNPDKVLKECAHNTYSEISPCGMLKTRVHTH